MVDTNATYEAREHSDGNAQPIELYKFQSGDIVYAYTSDFEDHRVLGIDYRAEPISRSNIVASNTDEGVQLEVSLPVSLEVVTEFAFDYAPPEELILTVYRFHEGDSDSAVIYWSGDVSSIRVEGNLARIVIPSKLTSAVASSLPGKLYQSPCNHMLYDSRCAITRGDHRMTTDVFGVDGTRVTLMTVLPTNLSPGSHGARHFVGGEIVASASGERRLITNTSGDRVFVSYPFRTLKAGDAVEIYPGCDHAVATCAAKFNNAANFGGFPFIPSRNVFKTGLK